MMMIVVLRTSEAATTGDHRLLLQASQPFRSSRLTVVMPAEEEKEVARRAQMAVRLCQGRFVSWSKKILHLVVMKQGLITTNAYISTLGGGYFLCRYLDHAKRMAGKQYLIAKKLNEPILMSQCCIHMAYSLIHEGSYRSAYNIIVNQERIAAKLQNNELKAIVSSAKHYLDKIKHVKALKEIRVKRLTKSRHKELLSDNNKVEVGVVTEAMSDNFQRHHVVRLVD